VKPDIIVLLYFINDAEPIPTYDQTAGSMSTRRLDRPQLRLDALRRQFGVQPDWRHYYRNLTTRTTPGWIRPTVALPTSPALAREMGVPLIVFNIPELRELKRTAFADVTARSARLSKT